MYVKHCIARGQGKIDKCQHSVPFSGQEVRSVSGRSYAIQFPTFLLVLSDRSKPVPTGTASFWNNRCILSKKWRYRLRFRRMRGIALSSLKLRIRALLTSIQPTVHLLMFDGANDWQTSMRKICKHLSCFQESFVYFLRNSGGHTMNKKSDIAVKTKEDMPDASRSQWHPLIDLREEIENVFDEFQGGWTFGRL